MNKFKYFTAKSTWVSALAAALLLPGGLRLEAVAPATTVTVSKDDNVPAATHKKAGTSITYTNTITNTGAVDAANVQFTDPDVAHAAYKAGTLSATPVAVDDSYAPVVLANTSIDTSVGTGFNVLSNDFYGYAGGAALPAANAAVTVAVTTAPLHGTVVFNGGANKGTFVYTPTAGYKGADSFKYTISNGVSGAPSGSDQGTVTLTVGGTVVWYVDAVNGSDANIGTLGHPFKTLGKVSTVDAVNQKIFLIGTNTANYTGGIVLKIGEALVGQAAQGGNFDTVLGVSANIDTPARPTMTPGGSRPQVTNSGGNAITLAEGNVVVGLDVTSAAGSGISGTNVNSGTIGNPTVVDLSISGTTGNGIALSGGSGTFSINAPITNGAGHSVNISSRSGGTVTFGQAIGDSGTGITLVNNAGATINFVAVITASTGGNTAFNATGGGTVTVTAVTSTLATTTGIALNVVSTTIGAGGLTFKSINAGTAGSGPVNGIVLSATGTSGSLTVTGNGNTSVGGDNSGGTIQRTTGAGIALAGTLSPSFTNMNILNTSRSGIAGTGVVNFTLTNSNINTTGSQTGDANIAFNSTNYSGAPTLNGNNISGTLSITKNTMSNGFAAGLDIQCDDGTVTNATVTNNVVSNATAGGLGGTAALSFVGIGNGTTSFSLNNASISNNTISGQKAGGIQVSIGNSSLGGGAVAHAGFVTIDGLGRPVSDSNHIISITGNSITSIDTNGTQAITVANSCRNNSFRTQTNFEIRNNGTAGTPLGSSGIGTVVLIGNNGNSDMAGVVDNNVITATHTPNGGGGNGIAGGNGVTNGNTDTPRLSLVVTNNNIHGTDGNGMLLVGRGVSGNFYLKVASNTVGAPVNAGGTAREGIRVDAGNNSSADDAVFLNIFSNISAGSNAASGIGLRKNGTVATTNDFSIYDSTGSTLAATPTNAQVTTFVNGLNPGSATGGGFGTGGTDIISGSNYLRDTTFAPPLIFAAGGIEKVKAEAPAATSLTAGSAEQTGSPLKAPAARAFSPEAAPAGAGSSSRIQQRDLDAAVAAAMARWQASGLTDEQLAYLRGMKFEVVSLSDNHLGEADGDTIRVDANAGGNGWFTEVSEASDALFSAQTAPTRRYTLPTAAPAGHVDLLTTIIHEMGHVLGLNDTYSLMERNNIMYGHLTKGERRLPAKDQARGATPFNGGVTHFLTNVAPDPVGNPTGIDTLINPVSIAKLPAGKGVVITYDVQIENPIVGATQLDSQATVSSTSGSFATTQSVDFAGGAATGQAHTFTILAVPPTVSATTTTVAQNASVVIITGTFFDTTPANNTVLFNLGAVGTVTAATSTQLTVAFSTKPTSLGSLTAIVTTPDGDSGAATQVANIVPAPSITPATTSLGITSSTVTINGSNFSPTPAQNTVVFNDGAVGTVTAATATQLTVTLSTQPTALGSLTANVTSFGGASGAIQVATVVPVVTTNTGTVAANAASFSIGGVGFSATAASNSVSFSGGGTGSITPSAATTTSLTTALPTGVVAGALNAVVTTSTFTSTPAVQVATVAPFVTSTSTAVAANAATVSIAGFGFDPVAAHNTVAFTNGAVGTVSGATNTTLTVTLSTLPTNAGSLQAIVTTNGVSSGASTQVATVFPVVTSSSATLQNTATTLTISGFGFASSNASNSVTLSSGTGSVTSSSPTQLVVTFGTAPIVGNLTAVVTSNTQSSGAAVQVATVISLSITSSTANLVQSAATLTIAGTGFSTTPANNTVTFNNGAVGTVTAATATQLTVTFSTNATALGALNATVAVVGTGSTGPTQVATVVAGAAAKLAVTTQPTNAISAAAISPAVTVQIQDANGFLTTSTANVTMAIGSNPGGGTLSGTVTVAAVNGTATFSTLNIDKAGAGYTLSATSGALTAATSGTFNITPGIPAKLAVGTQPTNAVSATAISPAVTVQIQDAAGNLTTTSTTAVTLAIGTNPSSGTLSGSTTVTAVAGVATFSALQIDKAGVGYTLSATSGALTAATSSAFNITAGAAAKLAVIAQPTNAVSAAAISPAVTVQIQDAAGNLTTSTASVTMAIGTNPGSGTLSGTATVAAVAGTATFSTLQIDKAGTGYTLAASSAGLTAATSSTFNITAGAASKLAVITQPTNTVSATAISPAVTVQIQDAAGNLTTSTANVVIAIGTNPSSGALTGTTTVAAVAGVATFSTLKIDKAGTGYTLSATSGALTPATSSTFNITAGAAAKLAVIAQPTNTVSATAISPAVTVQIQDAAGNLTASTANVVMAIGTNPSSGALSGTTTVAAVSGVATFSALQIDKAGTGYTLSATSGALTSATSTAFNITAGAAAKLAVIAQPTTAVAGVAISPAVTVQIQDAAGNLTTSTASVTMGFGSNPGGGTLSGTATVNAVAGTATFSTLSINKVGTGYTLSSSSAGLTSATSGAFNITPAAAAALVLSAPGTAAAGTAVSVSVTAKDVFGNTATGYAGTVHFTSATDTNALLPANGTLTAGAGNFNVTFENAGSQTVTGTDTVTSSIAGTTSGIAVGEAITLVATDASASVGVVDTGTYRFTRGGNGAAVTVNFTLDVSSTASTGEFALTGGSVSFNGSTGTVIIPAGNTSVDLTLTASSAGSGGIAKPSKTVQLDVATGSSYTVGAPSAGTVTILQNGFVVFNTSDSGQGSLRQAIANANALAGDDTITFDSMMFGSAQTITLSTGSLNVSGNGKAVIVAPAVGLTISGGHADRVFMTTSGTADLTLYGMAIINGSASGNGGGVYVNGGALTVIEAVIAGNAASGAGGGVASASGSTVRVINSTISGNTALGTATAGGIDSAGALTLINTTISGNSVSTTNAANAGGIKQAGTASILNTTITNNSTGGSVGAGGMLVSSGTVSVGNTLIAANVNNSTTADISGVFTSLGSNLIGNKGTATGFTNGVSGDLVGTGAAVLDPKLGALANNGGTTQTHILLSGSPAINTGNSALLPADTYDLDGDSNVAEVLPVDQRGVGFPRIQGSSVDIGAVEGLIFTPSLTAATTNEDTQSSSGLVITANPADAGGTTNYQITAITGGTLYKSNGTTAIANNDFITKAEGAAGLKFTPSADLFSPTTTFGFSVQASISAISTGLKDAVVPASITVNPVADTPTVTGTSTTVNIQSVSGLVITRNAVDGAEVGFFKISNIQHGTLYQNNGTTVINAGDFITVAQGGAGLKFTSALNYSGPASFDVQGSVDNAGTGLSGTATAAILVGTVNPTPVQLVPTDPNTGLPLPPGSAYPVVSQSGTYEVRTSIKNTTAAPINGFRLSVDYSAYLAAQPSLRLYNSSSAPGVVPAFIDYPFPVAVGATVNLKLQFYTSTRTIPNPFSPTLTVTTLAASEVSSTDGSGVQPRINVRPNGTVLLEWDSIPGHWYRIKYSADLTHWFDSPVPTQAVANRTQWLDDGAPLTNVSPATVPARFYRVNEIAAPTP